MRHLASKVGELVASNVSSLLDSATDPAKMVRLLQARVEETIISLQGDLTRARRRHERLTATIAQTRQGEADWTDKARLAMDHQREDLARAALLARENVRNTLAAAQAELASLAAEAAEIEAAIGQLEAKRQETVAQLAALKTQAAPASPSASPRPSRTERQLDRLDELEQRVDYAAPDQAVEDDAATAAGLARMARDARLEKELATLRAATSKPGKRKPKG